MKTKTTAIKTAREQVGELFRFGNGWKYSEYVPSMNAYRESIAQPYYTARRHRSNALIRTALESLGITDGCQFVEFDGGVWTDYI